MTTIVDETHDVVDDRVASAVHALLADLEIATPSEALPGADLVVAAEQRRVLPEPGRLLRAADGWFHPGPPTVWADFTAMAVALGARPPVAPDQLPDVTALTIDALDAEAASWLLPATAVRPGPAVAPPVADVPTSTAASVAGAYVAVLGTAWATPLVGLLLAHLGVDVVRVDDPRREDPFPLASHLAAGQQRVALDLATASGKDALRSLVASVDLLVDGYTPRVLANAGLSDDVLDQELPHVARLRIAAFADNDRPGYGLAAECRGGWAARTDPPTLGRSSVADPVAGCLGAREAVALLYTGGGVARVSLEGAVGYLLAREVHP
jgi:hypothetical protein